MKKSVNSKRIFKYFLAFFWGIIIFLPIFNPAPAIAGSSAISLASSPALAAELARQTRGSILSNPAARNNIVKFSRKSKLTGTIINQTTITTQPTIKDIIIRESIRVGADLVGEGLKRFFFDSDDLNNIRDKALEKFNSSSGSWQGLYIDGIYRGDILNPSPSQFQWFAYSWGTILRISGQGWGCIDYGYNVPALADFTFSPPQYPPYSLGSPQSCGSSKAWDDLTDQEKKDALDSLSDDDILKFYNEDPNFDPDGIPEPGLEDEICLEGNFDIISSDSLNIENISNLCFIQDPPGSGLDNDSGGGSGGGSGGSDGGSGGSDDGSGDNDPNDPSDNDPMIQACEKCEYPEDWISVSFFTHTVERLKEKFPFDAIGSLGDLPPENQCPKLKFFGNEKDLCLVNDSFRYLKYPIWISFFLRLIVSL